MEKKLDGNYTRMFHVVLNWSCKQHPIKQQLYDHLPPISQTILVKWTRHLGDCWWGKDELMSHILLWTPIHGHVNVGWLARMFIHQLCEDTGCCLDGLYEKVKGTHTVGILMLIFWKLFLSSRVLKDISKSIKWCFTNWGVALWCNGKAIDCRIVVSEFELQSRCYVHFRANTLRKGMNLLILLAMG